MMDDQFLDGLAISGILPAPLIIFSTFVGHLGGGPWGALVLTAGVFLPAFAFTLVSHGILEKIMAYRPFHAFLDGMASGVTGLIAATALSIFFNAVEGLFAAAVFFLSIVILYRWNSKMAVVWVVLGAGFLGIGFWR